MRKVFVLVLFALLIGCTTPKLIHTSPVPILEVNEYIKVIMEVKIVGPMGPQLPLFLGRAEKTEAHCIRAVTAARMFNVKHRDSPYRIFVMCYVHLGDKYA